MKHELAKRPWATPMIAPAFLAHPELIQEALNHGYWWALKYAPKETWTTPGLQQEFKYRVTPSVLKGLADGSIQLQDLPDTLKYDRIPDRIGMAPTKAIMNQDVVMTAVRANPRAASHVTDLRFAEDPEFLQLIAPMVTLWTEQVQQGPEPVPFQNLPILAQAIPSILTAAIRTKTGPELRKLYRSLSLEMQANEDLVMTLLSKDASRVWPDLDSSLRDRRRLQLAAISTLGWRTLVYIPNTRPISPDVIEAAVPSALKAIKNRDHSPLGVCWAEFPQELHQHPLILEEILHADPWADSPDGCPQSILLESACRHIMENPDVWPDQQLDAVEERCMKEVHNINYYKKQQETIRKIIIKAGQLAKQRDPSIESRLPGWLRS